MASQSCRPEIFFACKKRSNATAKDVLCSFSEGGLDLHHYIITLNTEDGKPVAQQMDWWANQTEMSKARRRKEKDVFRHGSPPQMLCYLEWFARHLDFALISHVNPDVFVFCVCFLKHNCGTNRRWTKFLWLEVFWNICGKSFSKKVTKR